MTILDIMSGGCGMEAETNNAEKERLGGDVPNLLSLAGRYEMVKGNIKESVSKRV